MRKTISTLCAAVLAAASIFLFGCGAAGYTVFPSVAVFSDDILFSARIMGGRAEYAYERMTDELKAIDSAVSVTNPNSDISRFNVAAANEKIEVGKIAYDLAVLGLELYESTDGAFNTASAPLCRLWHVDARSIADIKSSGRTDVELPTPEAVRLALDYCDPRLVSAEEIDGKYYLTKSDARVELDFGGIAKGYAADRCAQILRDYEIASALIDISGNVYLYGDYIENGAGGAWRLGVVSPRPRGDRGYVCAVSVPGNTSAVTSGDYMRYYRSDKSGEPVYISHIIGRTGVPVGVVWDEDRDLWKNASEWVVSASVFGECSARCDALCTAAVASGLESGAKLIKKCGYKGLIFTEKRYTIINGVELYRPDVYDGIDGYSYYEL